MRSYSLCRLMILLLTISVCTSASAIDEKNAKERDDYELMKLFVDVFQQVETNYARDVDRRRLMESAIRGMLRDLDQYSSFIPPRSVQRLNQMVEQQFGGIGITVNTRGGRLVVISPLPETPAYNAGIRAGDVIVEVEGESMRGVSLTDAVKKLQGPVGRPVTIKLLRPGSDSEPEEKTLVRQLIKAPTVRGERYNDQNEWDFMLQEDPKIGYIRMSHFSRFTAREVKAALDRLVAGEMEGLILDLRFNPGGLLESAIEIADMFLDKGNIVSVKGRNVPDRSWDAKKDNTYQEFPIAILVNGLSASASEVLSACLQDNKRAVVIGERTWGKGSVQNIIRLEDGDSALKLTTASYFRPSGVNIHRFPRMKASEDWGVSPDEGFEIPYTTAEWNSWTDDRQRRDVLGSPPGADDEEEKGFEDRQLLAAVEYLKEQLGPSDKASVDE